MGASFVSARGCSCPWVCVWKYKLRNWNNWRWNYTIYFNVHLKQFGNILLYVVYTSLFLPELCNQVLISTWSPNTLSHQMFWCLVDLKTNMRLTALHTVLTFLFEFLITTTLWSRCYYHIHFKVRKTEAWN